MSLTKRFPRLLSFLVAALVLLLTVAATAWHQLPVVIYKLALVSLAAVVGYWLDRALFPYARPDSFLVNDWRITPVSETGSLGAVDYPIVGGYQAIYAAAMYRRAIIVAAVVIGTAVGL